MTDRDGLAKDLAQVPRQQSEAEVAASFHRPVERLAASPLSALLLGETGVGTAHWAQTLHRLSSRAARPFVIVTCAAASEPLLERELFGYEGPNSSQPGALETAEGGTLFLDRVDELPLSTQAKLLRAIETRQTLRVGATQPRAWDAGILSASRRDLDPEVAAGRFRPDLYFQLAVFVLRELREAIDRVVLLCGGGPIPPNHFMDLAPAVSDATAMRAASSSKMDLEKLITEARVKEILEALASCGGNQTRAAKLLGISRRTLVKRMAQHQLPRPRASSR